MDSVQMIEKALSKACYTKALEIGEDNLGRVPVLFGELFPERKGIIITDTISWNLAGEKVYQEMLSAGLECEKYIIQDAKVFAEWKYIQLIDTVLDASGAVAIAVGSGVINDICKLCSRHHSQSYMCVPTAASVDGFSSYGASISFKGVKRKFPCMAPVALVADVNIIAEAPANMTAGGYADLSAKIPCGAEWMIADLFGTEPIIPDAWHVIQDPLDEMLSNPEGIVAKDHDAIAKLFQGLSLSGISMQIARSSRPASCTDHLFSHYLDMISHRYNGQIQSHGFQVAIGTLTMCAFFDAFLSLDMSSLDVDKCVEAWPTLEQEQARAREVFKDFVDPDLGCQEMSKKYHSKETVRIQLTKLKEQWPEFSQKLRQQVYPFEKMKSLYKIVGAPTDPSDIGVSREMLKSIVPFTQLMRNRINLLDLAKRAMIYDQLVDMVFGEGGVWDVAKEKMA